MSLGALDGLKRGSSRLDFLKQTLQPEVPAGGRRGSLAGIGKAVPPPKGSISFTVSWLPDGGVWRPPSSGDLRCNLPTSSYTAERVGRARASKERGNSPANSPAKRAEAGGGGGGGGRGGSFSAALGEADAGGTRLFGAWRLGGDKEDEGLVASARSPRSPRSPR